MVYDVNTLMIVIKTHHEATYSEKNWNFEDKFWWANVRSLVGKCPVGTCPLTVLSCPNLIIIS